MVAHRHQLRRPDVCMTRCVRCQTDMSKRFAEADRQSYAYCLHVSILRVLEYYSTLYWITCTRSIKCTPRSTGIVLRTRSTCTGVIRYWRTVSYMLSNMENGQSLLWNFNTVPLVLFPPHCMLHLFHRIKFHLKITYLVFCVGTQHSHSEPCERLRT